MRKKLTTFSLFMVITTASSAEDSIRPGLWEITTTSDFLALVPHIPSQHMQQIASLAKQYGLLIPQIKNGTATSHICITQEMAKQKIPTYIYDNQSGCSVKNATRAGNRYQMDLACTNAQFQGNGIAEGTFTSPEYFSGHTEFDSTVLGNSVHATAETNGRWLDENCNPANPLP